MILTLCGSASAAAPSANFTSNTTNGFAPLSVQFKDTSTGNPTSWSWDFGDGTTSTQQNPKHTYSTVGAYTVKLTASNSDGSNDLTKKNYITAWNASNPMKSNNGITFYVANDAGVKYDMPNGVNQQGDYAAIYVPNSYYISRGGGGMNPIQLSTDPNNKVGTKTNSTSQSGTFWVVFSGGIGHLDDAILMLAVNGTIPDNFSLHITSSGYTYDLAAPALTNPATSSLTNVKWVDNALNETFYKNDFIYGPQSWKPTNSVNYPIYQGQDPSNNFSLMFIDLNVGAFCTNAYSGVTDGSIRVDYSFSNLESFAAFGAYGWFSACNWGTGIPMASNIAQSGYNVIGVPSAEFAANATSGSAPMDVQFNDKSTNNPTSWSWDFGDGITSNEQNPTHTYSKPGVYTVTFTATNAGGSNTETMYITVLDANAPVVHVNLPNGSYNTGKSVSLTAEDDFDQNPVIYYSIDHGSTWKSAAKSVTLTLDEGNTTIWYYAKDNAGNAGTIQVASYTIDTTAPAVDNSLASGTYNTTKTVTLNASDSFDTSPVIYYSTDNGVTWKSAAKSVTLTLDEGNTTLMYYTKDNMGNVGAIQTTTYTVDITTPTVDNNLASGTYNTAKTVTLSAADNLDTNPVIYYSTDGGVTWSNATGMVTLTLDEGNTTIWYYVKDNAGNSGAIQVASYTIDTTAPAVDNSLASGTYNTTKTVTLSAVDSVDANPVIYYSTDGGVTWSNAAKSVTLNLSEGNTTLMYYTKDNMGNVGAIQTAAYIIDTIVPLVNVSETGGNYNTTQTVTLNVSDNLDQNSTIYYTTDGSDPTVNSNKYTGPISISSTTTLKFMAVDAAGNVSQIQTETYNIKSDVYLQVIPSKINPQVGNNVTYTFKVGNNGPGIAQNVVFTYVIPEGLKFDGASVDQGTWQYDEATRTLTWNLGNVTVGDPNLWLNVSVLSAGTFNIQPELSVSGYDSGLESNIGSLPVTAVPASTDDNSGSTGNGSGSNSGSGSGSTGNNSSSGSTEGTTVHAVTTTVTKIVPMQDTGLPIGGLVSALLLVGSGLALGRKK